MVFLECVDALLKVEFFILTQIFTKSLLNIKYSFLFCAKLRVDSNSFEFVNELFFRVSSLPLSILKFIVGALEQSIR